MSVHTNKKSHDTFKKITNWSLRYNDSAQLSYINYINYLSIYRKAAIILKEKSSTHGQQSGILIASLSTSSLP
jgi:hypothetical protein